MLKGSDGTICSYDYEDTVRVQTNDRPEGYDQPVDLLDAAQSECDPVLSSIAWRLENEPEGPLSPAICRIGQQIVDSAILSAREKRTVPLLP